MAALTHEKIGEEAGKVWMLLGDKGSLQIAQIPRLLNDSSELVYQALGWLARESKLHYKVAGGATSVSLNDFEAQVYRSLFSRAGSAPVAPAGTNASGKVTASRGAVKS
jgi:hypothetical protein